MAQIGISVTQLLKLRDLLQGTSAAFAYVGHYGVDDLRGLAKDSLLRFSDVAIFYIGQCVKQFFQRYFRFVEQRVFNRWRARK